MPIERSAGTVIFKKKGKNVYYLLLHYPRGARNPQSFWDFPKGHIEKGEKPTEAAKREAREETGLTRIDILEGFKETIKYFFRFEEKTILKFVTFFLARTKEEKVKVSFEHIGFQWLLYPEAFKELTFKNAKEILKKANDFLSEKGV